MLRRKVGGNIPAEVAFLVPIPTGGRPSWREPGCSTVEGSQYVALSPIEGFRQISRFHGPAGCLFEHHAVKGAVSAMHSDDLVRASDWSAHSRVGLAEMADPFQLGNDLAAAAMFIACDPQDALHGALAIDEDKILRIAQEPE